MAGGGGGEGLRQLKTMVFLFMPSIALPHPPLKFLTEVFHCPQYFIDTIEKTIHRTKIKEFRQ
jgi:hypothetical protein